MQLSHKVSLLLVIAAACITSGLVYFSGSNTGPGLTYDSVNYLYAGHSLWEKGKLNRPFGKPFVEWPPLFPTIIAMLFATTPHVMKGIFYLQIIISGVSAFLAGRLARRIIGEPFIFFTALVAICFSTPLVLVNHFVWSESLFILLTLVYIKVLIQYVQRLEKRYLWTLIAIGIFLCLQRYVGVFFVVANVFVLWRYAFNRSFLPSLCIGALQVSPMTLWCIYNFISYSTFMNKELKFPSEPLAYIGRFSQLLTSWFLPDELNQWFALLLFILLLLFLLNRFLKENGPKTGMHRIDLIVTGSIFFLYMILSLVGSFITTEEIEDRKLAIVYIPGILLIFCLLDGYAASEARKPNKKWLLYICFIWMLYPISRTCYNSYRWHHQQAGLPASQPVETEFTQFLQFPQ
jgi:hypothetical protein